MTKEEIRFQVALSCIQGVLEAKHGIIGEIVPSVAVAESLRIADEFVKQWFKEEDKHSKPLGSVISVHREKLMEMPTNFNPHNFVHQYLYGKDMKDRKYHSGETTWCFPEGVKEKIKDDKKYSVWYEYRDAADPCDSSVNYTVYYIECW